MCFGFGCPRTCTPEDYKLLCAVPAVSWNDFTPAIAGTVHVKTFIIHLPLSLCSWHDSFFILTDGENVFSPRGKKGIKTLLWNSIQNAHVRRKKCLKYVFYLSDLSQTCCLLPTSHFNPWRHNRGILTSFSLLLNMLIFLFSLTR